MQKVKPNVTHGKRLGQSTEVRAPKSCFYNTAKILPRVQKSEYLGFTYTRLTAFKGEG